MGDNPRVRVVANAIGWELYHSDGRAVTDKEGTGQIVVNDDELAVCMRIARRVVHDLAEYDQSKEADTAATTET